jgi:hypothetical protein
MENNIKPEICSNCQGKGIIATTGNVCEESRGFGALGTDGKEKYYLGLD